MGVSTSTNIDSKLTRHAFPNFELTFPSPAVSAFDVAVGSANLVLKRQRSKLGSRLAPYKGMFLNGAVNVFTPHTSVSHFDSGITRALHHILVSLLKRVPTRASQGPCMSHCVASQKRADLGLTRALANSPLSLLKRVSGWVS